MNKKIHPITDWLDSNSRREPPIYKLNHRSFETYYFENDKNLSTNNDYKVKELMELNKKINKSYNYEELIEGKSIGELEYEDDLIKESNYVHVFKKNDNRRYIQYIDPDSRRYHTNMLFNMILDYCKTNEIHDFKNNLLIGKKMRNDFVKFCYKNRN